MYVRAPWVNHFGFTKTPFGKSIPAKNLFARQAHDEAVARVRFSISEATVGVITVRSALARRSPSGPPPTVSTPPATRSSTSPTPPSALAAST